MHLLPVAAIALSIATQLMPADALTINLGGDSDRSSHRDREERRREQRADDRREQRRDDRRDERRRDAVPRAIHRIITGDDASRSLPHRR